MKNKIVKWTNLRSNMQMGLEDIMSIYSPMYLDLMEDFLFNHSSFSLKYSKLNLFFTVGLKVGTYTVISSSNVVTESYGLWFETTAKDWDEKIICAPRSYQIIQEDMADKKTLKIAMKSAMTDSKRWMEKTIETRIKERVNYPTTKDG